MPPSSSLLIFFKGVRGETRGGSNPAFGTIVILKGNLAQRQIPFFVKNGLTGSFKVRGFFPHPRARPKPILNLVQEFRPTGDGTCYGDRTSVMIRGSVSCGTGAEEVVKAVESPFLQIFRAPVGTCICVVDRIDPALLLCGVSDSPEETCRCEAAGPAHRRVPSREVDARRCAHGARRAVGAEQFLGV